VAYLSYSTSLEQPTKLYESIKSAWKEHGKELKGFLKGVSDVLEVAKGGKEKKLERGEAKEKIEKIEENETELGEVLKSLNPRKENVFIVYEADQEKLKQ